jgi:putative hydrolase of the HAD superfamily
MLMTSTGDTPDVILFDLGGVLMDFAGFEELVAYLPEPVEPDEIRERWLLSAPVRDFDLGRIDATEFAARFVSEWKASLSPAGFLKEFANWLHGFYPGAESLLRDLGKRYRLACLSNTNEIHWHVIRDALDPFFERAFLSFQLGLAKPDPAIFQAAVSDLDTEPDAILFFDDSRPNVESAAGVGLRAELVRGPDELRERLKELELLTD